MGKKAEALKTAIAVIAAAKEAREARTTGWQGKWLQAVEGVNGYITQLAFKSGASPLPRGQSDKIMALSMFLAETADLLNDEIDGAEAHFWTRKKHRAPLSSQVMNKRVALVVLYRACAKQKRQAQSSVPTERLVQAELRKRNVTVSLNEIRNQRSNQSRLPKRYREEIKSWKALIKLNYVDLSEVIELATKALDSRK